MDKVSLPEYDAVSLDNIAEAVIGLRILFVNVFAITSESGWSLIDAGIPWSAGRIRNWAKEKFGNNDRPESIILTHGHFDHVGAIEELLREWDVPVYAHPLEMPFLNGQSQYPPPNPAAGGGLMAVMSPLYPRGPINISKQLQNLPGGGGVPGLSDWKWLHTPGHTAGHISLFREKDRALVVGDAFCTTKAESMLGVATQPTELHGPPAYYTSDWPAAKASVEKLALLDARVLVPGHGLPLAGKDVPEAVATLAREFSRIAVPDNRTAA